MQGRDEKCTQGFGGKPRRTEKKLEVVAVDGRITLKLLLNK
jgi:hypothetical protein